MQKRFTVTVVLIFMLVVVANSLDSSVTLATQSDLIASPKSEIESRSTSDEFTRSPVTFIEKAVMWDERVKSEMPEGPNAGATAITAGQTHTCALTHKGSIQCWGQNANGQLGDGTLDKRVMPVSVIGLDSGVNAISAGASHTCALVSSGSVKCWGDNYKGQLGDGTTTDRHTPVNVIGLGSNISTITTGYWHTCALTLSGGVKCWGDNGDGQLGDGTTTERHTPVNVSGLSSGVIAISAGADHTCALTSSGSVKCWGDNYKGQLGDGTTTDRHTPVNVGGLVNDVSVIAAGYNHTCAATTSATTKCWGSNNFGQLGDGTTTDQYTPVNVSGLDSDVIEITANGWIIWRHHTCALTSGGGIKCWGENGNGQLGDGTETERHTPVDVSGLLSGVSSITAGAFHTCAVTDSGMAKCWGENVHGQLGDGTKKTRLTPVNVIGFECGNRNIDLDVQNQRPYVSYGAMAVEPYTTTLAIKVKNHGPDAACNVKVELYDGPPNTGELLATTVIDEIEKTEGGGSQMVKIPWLAEHGTSADLFVRVEPASSNIDSNPNNNTTSGDTGMSVYYADFQYDPDTFKFENWDMGWYDFLDETLRYSNPFLPSNIESLAWSFGAGPLFYAGYANGGHCYGMAESSIVFWDTPLSRPLLKETYKLEDFEAKPEIRDHHARQSVQIASHRLSENVDVQNAYTQLLNLVSRGQPAILGISIGGTEDNHAITAYKIVEVEDEKNTKKIFVYENNSPMLTGLEDTPSASFKFENGQLNFNYNGYNEVYTEVPVRRTGEVFKRMLQIVYERYLRQLKDSAKAQIFLGSPATALVTDQYGRRIGHIGGVFVNEIPGAQMDDFGGAYRFEVPDSLEYTIKTTGTGSGTLSLSFEMPLSGDLMQEVVYTEVPVSFGSTSITHLGRSVTNWTMQLDGGQTWQPSLEQVIDLSTIVNNQVHIPLVINGLGNSAPYMPSAPIPADDTSYQPTSLILQWTGGDPDGDNVTYDVYFEANDSSPDQLKCGGYSVNSCNPGVLVDETNYYWKVVVQDSQGETKVGPVWSFTTAPDETGFAWREVGVGSASGGGISNNEGRSWWVSMSVAPDGIPYVAWEDRSNGNPEIYIRRWIGGKWQEVGTGSAIGGGISNYYSRMASIAITPNGKPWVAWDKYSTPSELNVRHWDGTQWQAANADSPGHPSIAMAPDGTPYIASSFHPSGWGCGINVRRWIGDTWQRVGSDAASGTGICPYGDFSFHADIAISPDGTPYVAWDDARSGNAEIYVKRWDGNQWHEVGAGSASGDGISDNNGQVYGPSIAISPDGTPYVTWMAGGIYVRRWNGSQWQEVGAGSATGDGIGKGAYPVIATASDGTPYIVWEVREGENHEVYGKRWNGSQWLEVGAGSASGGGISNDSGKSLRPWIAIAPDGTPYVSWHDEAEPGEPEEIYVRRWSRQ